MGDEWLSFVALSGTVGVDVINVWEIGLESEVGYCKQAELGRGINAQGQMEAFCSLFFTKDNGIFNIKQLFSPLL